jgi:hypothetical protein
VNLCPPKKHRIAGEEGMHVETAQARSAKKKHTLDYGELGYGAESTSGTANL